MLRLKDTAQVVDLHGFCTPPEGVVPLVSLETQKSFKYDFQNLCYLNFSGVLGVPRGETADLTKGTAERAPEATCILARGTARICKFRVRIGCEDAGVAPMVGAEPGDRR